MPTSIRKLWRSIARHRPAYTPGHTKPGGADGLDARVIENLIPIEEQHSDDIFVVGYPKSGNTWLQNLIAGAAYGVLAEFAPPKLVHLDLVPDVHQKKFYKRYSSPMFFKSHHLPRPEYRKVVYLLRDGRDAMVSYYQMWRRQGRSVDFLEMVQTGRNLFPCKWHEHVEAWLNNPFKAQLLIIRYEDLKADPIPQLQRLCQFAKLERPREHLERVTESCSFQKLQTREKQMGRTRDKPWKTEASFFRRGEVGSHRDEMPPEVEKAFLAEAAKALSQAGYALPEVQSSTA
jgi:hypothetical protein